MTTLIPPAVRLKSLSERMDDPSLFENIDGQHVELPPMSITEKIVAAISSPDRAGHR